MALWKLRRHAEALRSRRYRLIKPRIDRYRRRAMVCGSRSG